MCACTWAPVACCHFPTCASTRFLTAAHLALPDHGDDGAADDVVNQGAEEGLGAQVLYMSRAHTSAHGWYTS